MAIAALTKAYVDGIYKTKALLIKADPFTLASGMRSHVYLNHRHFLSDHQYLSLIARLYTALIGPIVGTYALGVVDSVMSPIIAGAMSVLSGRNIVIIQKKPMTHGTQEALFGQTCSDEVILIDDMSSTGETLIEAALKIRACGGIVQHAVISACREDTVIKNLKAYGIEVQFIAYFQTIIDQLQSQLTASERAILAQNPLIFE